MGQVEANGQTILLTHLDGAVHAVGGICPHAGGKLAEGVLHEGTVICPWHKAVFCARTGRMRAPPAMDDLPAYSVTQAGEQLLLRQAPRAPFAKQGADPRHFVIIGAGAAGANAAQTLRQEGFTGRVTMIDEHGRVPYDRTILSKYWLSGEKGGEKSPLRKQDWYVRHGIERVTASVTDIEPGARRVRCAGGQDFTYDALLLATGGAPKRPDLPGAGLPHVFLLRSRDDADALLARAEQSRRAVILGASFIGMEVAAALRERGLDVIVAGQEAQPFKQQLGPEIGAAFVSLHKQQGVAFRLGARVVSIAQDGVHLASGEFLPADFVVIGFGVTPRTECAASLARNDDASLSVDAYLRVTEGIYAAGDIARFPLGGQGATVRVEHWRVAEQHGRIAAMNMLGRQAAYADVPVFWTIQYLKRLDYIGHASGWDSVVIHGDLGKPEFLAYYVRDGIVAAAAGFGRDRETAALVALLGERRWRPDELGPSPATLLR